MKFFSHMYIGTFFLLLTGVFIVIEWALFPPKAEHAKVAVNSDHFEQFSSWIHHWLGYKFIFPTIGLIIIALIAFLLRPLLTTKKGRP